MSPSSYTTQEARSKVVPTSSTLQSDFPIRTETLSDWRATSHFWPSGTKRISKSQTVPCIHIYRKRRLFRSLVRSLRLRQTSYRAHFLSRPFRSAASHSRLIGRGTIRSLGRVPSRLILSRKWKSACRLRSPSNPIPRSSWSEEGISPSLGRSLQSYAETISRNLVLSSPSSGGRIFCHRIRQGR